jgi:predicted alpha/beta-fold hydrolase
MSLSAPIDFYPLPLLANPHVQTFLGAYLPGPGCTPQRRHVAPLDDGDRLLLYDNWPRGWRVGDPITVILHGLGGTASSPHVQRLAVMLLGRGVRVVRVNLRGAGEGVSLARGVYHACRSEDVRAALRFVRGWGESPLWLVGLSLGGGLALRVAGELNERPVAGLTRVAAVCPPIDLVRCCELLGAPANHYYNQMFVRIVVAEARERQRHFPDLPPLRLPSRLTFRQFDELYTAPRCGFAGALDYYRRGSVVDLVPSIPVPTFILTARDDPFITVEPLERMRLPRHVQTRIVPNGGHVGFVGWDSAWGVRWAERRVVDWLMAEE